MKWLYVILLILPLNLWALDPNEEFPLTITKVHRPDLVVVNRGLEDGLRLGDHIKFYQVGNFSARGVVVRTEKEKTFIKVYRIMGKLEQGASGFELVCINRSEIPDYIVKTLESTQEEVKTLLSQK